MAKKKIKDLTLEEAKKICANNGFCSTCPLSINNYCACNNNVLFSEEQLNKEIEIEEYHQKYKSLKGLC